MKHLCLLILGLMVSVVAAQDSSNRILVGVDGKWYSWSAGQASLQEIALDAPTSDVVFSPDRSKLVYRREVSDLNPGMFPADLFLVDVAANQTTQLTPSDNLLIRSMPAFSPDSTQVAWVEYTEASGSVAAYVMVYDIATATSTRIADWTLGFQDGGVYLATPQWTTAGILNPYFTFVEYPNAATNLQVIDPASGNSKEITLAEFDVNAYTGAFYPEMIYAFDPLSLLIVPVGATENVWMLNVDSETQVQGGTISQYGISIGDDFSVVYDRSLKEHLFAFRQQQFQRTGGDTFAVTPNGNGLLFTQFDRLFAIENGVTREVIQFPLQEITLVGALIDLNPLNSASVSTVNAPIGTCGLETRISQGQSVRVIEGLGANSLREVPGLDGNELGSIPEGGIAVGFLSKPRCADGYLWHNVAYNELYGWTAEGDLDGTYWLEPIN
jgi:hypothetical protein